MSTTFGELTSGESLDFQIRESSNFRYSSWGWYRGVGGIDMNRGD
jgi:hypothetical protein